VEHYKLHKTLHELLEKAGEQEQYESELHYLVLELKCQEAEYVSRLKAITSPAQWSAIFEALLANAKRPADRIQLYHLEEMYSELLAELSRYPNIGVFQSYENVLRNWDCEKTRKLYTETLKCEMERACDRKQYRYVASLLRGLKAYPFGITEAKALADYWYDHHKNRPAMKDELKKAGYPQK
jgi:hypothetical protein